ncbi:MAG: methyltransferase, partial [Thermoproteota archaeon]|nr:methyltransferase [Thermoproteota archaeon]
CNLEHVSSYQLDSRLDILVPLEWFLAKRIKTNRLLPVEKQLQMLRDIGFIEVDCLWKWYEMALLIGFKN